MNLYRDVDHALIALPADLLTFRGDRLRVERIAVNAGGGSSGKLETAAGLKYPGVFGCYIAAESDPERIARLERETAAGSSATKRRPAPARKLGQR